MPNAEGGTVEFAFLSFFLFFLCFFLCFPHVQAVLLGVIKITRLQRGNVGLGGGQRETNVYAANTFHVNTVWS